MTAQAKFSTPSKLIDLEAVVNTRTPVWDIAGSGDVRIKLDTDVNDQEWYVLSDDSKWGGYFKGKVECWAFPHWCGSHDQYAYEPVAFCFKTFTELLEAHPTEHAIWGYDVAKYEQRVRMASPSNDPFLPDYPEEDNRSHLKLVSDGTRKTLIEEESHSPQELIERMKMWGMHGIPLLPDTNLHELGVFNRDFPEAKTLAELTELYKAKDEETNKRS
jgi:hypothetical protein